MATGQQNDEQTGVLQYARRKKHEAIRSDPSQTMGYNQGRGEPPPAYLAALCATLSGLESGSTGRLRSPPGARLCQ